MLFFLLLKRRRRTPGTALLCLCLSTNKVVFYSKTQRCCSSCFWNTEEPQEPLCCSCSSETQKNPKNRFLSFCCSLLEEPQEPLLSKQEEQATRFRFLVSRCVSEQWLLAPRMVRFESGFSNNPKNRSVAQEAYHSLTRRTPRTPITPKTTRTALLQAETHRFSSIQEDQVLFWNTPCSSETAERFLGQEANTRAVLQRTPERQPSRRRNGVFQNHSLFQKNQDLFSWSSTTRMVRWTTERFLGFFCVSEARRTTERFLGREANTRAVLQRTPPLAASSSRTRLSLLLLPCVSEEDQACLNQTVCLRRRPGLFQEDQVCFGKTTLLVASC